jgi:hypothetical protein
VNVGLDNDLYEARNTDTWESDLTSDPLTTRLPSVVVTHAVGSRAEPSPHPSKCLVSFESRILYLPWFQPGKSSV